MNRKLKMCLTALLLLSPAVGCPSYESRATADMEELSEAVLRFKHLDKDLSVVGNTYTDDKGKTYRISRSARKKLEQLGLCKINEEKEVDVKYNPSSNVVDITISGYVFDSVMEDMGEILDQVDSLNIYATVDSKIHFDLRLINIYKGMPRYPGKLKL